LLVGYGGTDVVLTINKIYVLVIIITLLLSPKIIIAFIILFF